MTMSTKLIPIAPFGKARPRVSRNGQHTYMPPEYEQKKSQLRLLFGDVPNGGILSIAVVATKAMPKSWSKKKKTSMDGMYCDAKPDLDNIVGAVMDSLFEDDSKVVEFGSCRKVWGYEDSLEITVEEIDNE